MKPMMKNTQRRNACERSAQYQRDRPQTSETTTAATRNAPRVTGLRIAPPRVKCRVLTRPRSHRPISRPISGLGRDLEECVTYLRFPEIHHARIRTRSEERRVGKECRSR